MLITHTSHWLAGGGIGLLIVAGGLAQHSHSFIRTAARAAGVVTANVYSGRGMVSPQYEFQTPDGRRWQRTAMLYSNPPRFRVGQAISVLYRPQRPDDSTIDSWLELWLGPFVVGGFGVAGLVLAATIGT